MRAAAIIAIGAMLTSTSSSSLLASRAAVQGTSGNLGIVAWLRAGFAAAGTRTLRLPAGTYAIPCGTSLVAAGSLSLVGAGVDRSVLRLQRGCTLDRPLMSWVSKSHVQLSGFTLDLNSPQFDARQDVLQFAAFDGDTQGLRIDHIRIVGGRSPSLLVAVAAAGGFAYSNVVIDHNLLEMAPALTQNECIALSTVNGLGAIPNARVTNNVCRGSGIQADGEGTAIVGNDVSRYQFGTGIFTAFVTRTKLIGASWADGLATFHFGHASNSFVRGELIYIWDVRPKEFNGAFRVAEVGPTSLSLRMPTDPGAYVGGGFVAPGPSNRGCVIRNNVMHDTPQSLDVNGTAPGGIENNCVNSRLEGNRAYNLGGAGFVNFASGAAYFGNSATGVGFTGIGSAGGEADAGAFAVFDNGSGMPWYRSSGTVFDGNTSVLIDGRPRFGYYEEPFHLFGATLRNNAFHAAEQPMVVRKTATP